jgi:hypothetical protein
MKESVIESQRYFYNYEDIPAGVEAEITAYPQEFIEADRANKHTDANSVLPSFITYSEPKSHAAGGWLFGVVMPIACFYFDPIVFKGGFESSDAGLLSGFRGFAYTHAFITITATIIWLTLRSRFTWANAAFAGIFGVSALVSLLIGIVLLPFSLLGTLMLVGLLGFTPLISSLVMFRMASTAFRESQPHLERPAAINLFMWSALSVFVVSMLMNG